MRCMQNTSPNKRAILILLVDKRTSQSDIDARVTELWQLIQTLAGIDTIELFIQKGKPFDSTYIGTGKVEEVATFVKNNEIDVVIIGDTLDPTQKFNLTKRMWDDNPQIAVWDRIDLILEIFSKNAHTAEATLQIKLARMRHMGPAIFHMGEVLSRQGGGVGTRGIGETNTERMKRHWRREIKRTKDELTKLTKTRTNQINRRKALGLKTVSLVGYTNAGKTTLFNALTKKKKKVQDALFATLDSAVGQLYIPAIGQQVIVSDTIGFIKNLPPELIDAFGSTLLASVHADVILHVVDASDPAMIDNITVVTDILHQLDIPDEKIIMVYNKSDITSTDTPTIDTHAYPYPHVRISAKTGDGIDTLLSEILPLRLSDDV